jgi:hypothetical protein
MNGFRKIFPTFLSHYATFFAKMAGRKVIPFDEFYLRNTLYIITFLRKLQNKGNITLKTLDVRFNGCLTQVQSDSIVGIL